MGKCFLHGNGSGNPLNFEILHGTTEPLNPQANAIWLNTDKEVTGYHFTPTQPKDMAVGEVWICTGISSSVEFNALKENTLQVYPLFARQKVSDTLVDITAKIYQNGAWHDWWDGTVINGNNKYVEITGDWSEVIGETGSVTWDAGGVTLTYTGAYGRHASIYSKKSIDITSFKTLRAIVTSSAGTAANNMIGVRKSPTTSTQISEYAAGYAAHATVPISTSTQTINIDISSLSGAYYVQIASGIGTLKIEKLQFIT